MRGEIDRARQAIEQLSQPFLTQHCLIRAEIYEQLGRIGEAIEDYDRAISIASDLVSPRVNKAVLLFNNGLFAEALVEMNQVIALDERHSEHYENRAAIYKQLQLWDLCSEDMKKAELYRHLAPLTTS